MLRRKLRQKAGSAARSLAGTVSDAGSRAKEKTTEVSKSLAGTVSEGARKGKRAAKKKAASAKETAKQKAAEKKEEVKKKRERKKARKRMRRDRFEREENAAFTEALDEVADDVREAKKERFIERERERAGLDPETGERRDRPRRQPREPRDRRARARPERGRREPPPRRERRPQRVEASAPPPVAAPEVTGGLGMGLAMGAEYGAPRQPEPGRKRGSRDEPTAPAGGVGMDAMVYPEIGGGLLGGMMGGAGASPAGRESGSGSDRDRAPEAAAADPMFAGAMEVAPAMVFEPREPLESTEEQGVMAHPL